MKERMSKLCAWALLPMFFVGLVMFGCGKDDNPTTAEKTEYEVIQPAIHAYTGGSLSPTITAQSLFDNINDGNATNDYLVVSVRSATDYAKGHIAGALNIPWREVGKSESLAKLTSGKKLAVYCYTGHTGAIATTLFNMMGYEAYNLKFGITSWTKDATVRATSAFDDAVDAHDFAVETTANVPNTTYDLPALAYTTSSDNAEILRAAADYTAANMATPTTAQALFDNLNDGNTSNDPIIVSVRSAEHYALGHIPGAINIPWREIAKEENLKKLDPSKQIVVYCYTGHTGGVASTALATLGYKATNLKWGLMSWTRDAAVRAVAPFSETTEAHEFPVTTGSNP